jgi:excisionase family DNA binding protein
MNGPKYYNVKQVAERWGVSVDAVYKKLQTGALQGFKPGRGWRITEEALRAFETAPQVRANHSHSQANEPLKIY